MLPPFLISPGLTIMCPSWSQQGLALLNIKEASGTFSQKPLCRPPTIKTRPCKPNIFYPSPLWIIYLRIITKIHIHHTICTHINQNNQTKQNKKFLPTKIKTTSCQHLKKMDNLQEIHPLSLHHNYKRAPHDHSTLWIVLYLFCQLPLPITVLISKPHEPQVLVPKSLVPHRGTTPQSPRRHVGTLTTLLSHLRYL